MKKLNTHTQVVYIYIYKGKICKEGRLTAVMLPWRSVNWQTLFGDICQHSLFEPAIPLSGANL